MELIRKLILYFVSVLPNPLKRFYYRRFLGWSIGKNVHIGSLTIIESQNVCLKDNVIIGRFNAIRSLKYLEIGVKTSIASHNKIIGSNYEEWGNSFIIGDDCVVTSKHYFDAGGGIYIGDDAVIGGISSQIWSHELCLEKHKLMPKSVHIAKNVYIASSVLLSPGVTIPSNVTVGLGTVVPSKFKCIEGDLVVGNPACVKTKKTTILSKLNVAE